MSTLIKKDYDFKIKVIIHINKLVITFIKFIKYNKFF